jgi:arginine utilization regulatory protein
MANLKEFIMSNIDYVFVVNKDFKVVYNSKCDKNMENGGVDCGCDLEYKDLFEMYPSLGRNNSSIAKTMATGEIVFNDAQEFVDINGKVYVTRNITFPVFKDGKISGAVELTKDLTNVEHIKGKRESIDYFEAQSSFELKNKEDDTINFDDILTKDKEMIRSIEQAKIYACHRNPTLIYGETGTGKELFAQSMINFNPNKKQKVVVQNCAAVPENLIESILFGTTKGSYTGAENKKGLFEEADGGIFFLDELNALPYHVQGKLLRVLQDGTFRPIGSNKEKKVNVKIIAAMNIDPVTAIETNILRKDLFYRLSGSMIFLNPLRERKNDIEYLTNYYMETFNKIYNKKVNGISKELRELFLEYKWEGNVRELKNVIESMISVSRENILTEDQIPLYMHNKIKEARESYSEKNDRENNQKKTIINLDNGEYDLKKALEIVEKKLIISTLKKVNGNKTKAGKLLGIPRQTLKYKIDKWGIDDIEK